ncbi:MAG TPA: GGDEF domain-containing protein [Methylophilaceae bacterium]|jgi:diguanylate cyclase
MQKLSAEIMQSCPAARQAIQEIIKRDKAELADFFYTAMLADEEAAAFLEPETVQSRLKQSMMHWMETLFCFDTASAFEAAIAMQRHVGDVHARTEIPVNLVARGMRLLKREIQNRLIDVDQDREALIEAILLVDRLTDIAFEEMSAAFVRAHERNVRADEAFRLFAAGQNIAAERERQFGALLEWENSVFRVMTTDSDLSNLPELHISAFGLWLNHKASLMFNERLELQTMTEAVECIDHEILPQLVEADGEQSRQLLRRLLQETERIKFMLSEMFDRLADLEVGRDTLTQLYNRRFLASIMRREIELCRRRRIGFAVLMIDVDHFKRINDEYGHDAGDQVLQQIAVHLLNNARAGDFVFRYGGEEFLIVLAEVDEAAAMRVGEKLRKRIEEAEILLANNRRLRVTVSIGIATSDGHPDYKRIVERADAALYQAKNNGRNRVHVLNR